MSDLGKRKIDRVISAIFSTKEATAFNGLSFLKKNRQKFNFKAKNLKFSASLRAKDGKTRFIVFHSIGAQIVPDFGKENRSSYQIFFQKERAQWPLL